jgi:hypothetical protein
MNFINCPIMCAATVGNVTTRRSPGGSNLRIGVVERRRQDGVFGGPANVGNAFAQLPRLHFAQLFAHEKRRLDARVIGDEVQIGPVFGGLRQVGRVPLSGLGGPGARPLCTQMFLKPGFVSFSFR